VLELKKKANKKIQKNPTLKIEIEKKNDKKKTIDKKMNIRHTRLPLLAQHV
jgi:hypothetical protein